MTDDPAETWRLVGPTRAEIQRVTRIDPLLIQDEFTRVPGDLAYYNELYAQALQAFLEAEHRLKTLGHRLSMKYREILRAEVGRATEAMVLERVETDTDWITAKLDEIDATVAKNRARGILDAIEAKRSALISLGAHIREELKGDPTLRSQMASQHYSKPSTSPQTPHDPHNWNDTNE